MMFKSQYKSFIVTFMLIISCQAYGETQKILVLHSYHQGLEWTDNISAGINSILRGATNDTEVYYQYLDTKRNSGPLYYKKLMELFNSKQKNTHFDLIITADNNALEFIKNFGEQFYPRVPVVFCGVNSFSSSMIAGIHQVTGVVEKIDYQATLELMLSIHPKTKKILVVVDQTNTGKAIKKEVQEVGLKFKDRVTLEYYSDFTWAKLPADIAALSHDYLIYLLTANRDNNSEFVSYMDGINIIKRSASVPIYASWDFYLGKGIVGGVITSGFVQGEKAATLALKILSGESANNLAIISNIQNKPIFDFSVMTNFKITKSQLPKNSRIINEPPGLLDKFGYILRWFTILALGSILLLILKLYSERRKQAQIVGMNIRLAQQVKQKTSELNDSSEKLNKLINTLPSPVFYKDTQCVYQMCNDAFATTIIGLPKEKIIGHSLTDLADNIPPHLAEIYNAQDIRLMQNPGTQFYEARVECVDATLRDYMFHKATLKGHTEKVSGIIGVMLDITERKKIEINLKESEERFRRLQEASFEGIAIHKEGILLDANQRLSEMTNFSHDELIGLSALKLFASSSKNKIKNIIMNENKNFYEAEAVKKDGSVYHVEIRSRRISYQGKMARVAVIRDITKELIAHRERDKLIAALKRANRKLNTIAITDALTGISNRGYISQRFSEALKEAKRYGHKLSIVMFDIDFFKRVNDTKGHQVGDFVLQQISLTIQECIRECDLIGRYGGEEFLLILPHTGIGNGYLLAEHIRETIKSLIWEDPDLQITISGGIAEYNGESEETLLHAADTQLYRAKSEGRDRINK